MTIDAVLFDLGNVLVRWQWRAALVGVADDDHLDRFAAGFPALNARLDAGEPWAEVVAGLAERDPALAHVLGLYRERYALSLTGPVPGSARIVAELKAAGVRLVGLTNWSAETWDAALPAAPAIGLLDAIVVSGFEGVAKPDPRIFAIAVSRHGLVPARTLFVDDAPVNVAAAAALGFDAVLFTGADDLRCALTARNLLPPRS